MGLDKEALEAYLKLLRHAKPITIRGFQRLMGYASPGKAQRVLNKLEKLGFAVKTSTGEYAASRELPIELSMYTVFERFIIPRSLTYAIYSTTVVTVYSALAKPSIHVVILMLALVTPYWIDTLNGVRILRKVLKNRQSKA
ncbi:MAG: hypothetical protein RMI83_06340 [Desulfurococcaceae archaeon]|nr:hypothetical protein [Sulfolobales archaeon]MDW8170697.1 hypothetical protein [Desulfurococcaceae archaeon]